MPLWKHLLLYLYYYGSYPIRSWQRRRDIAADQVPVVILYYHRIADDRANDWTMPYQMFAQQIRWLRDHFDLISLQEVQEVMRRGKNRRPCVSITFDDGYADNCREAIPLLVKERIPCTYFVTTRNVLHGEPFAHDVAQGNRLLPNSVEQLRAMAGAGIEIGAHTYTHADLGRIIAADGIDGAIDARRKLHYEIVSATEDLRDAVGCPVRYFAFPFGQYVNLSRQAFEMAQDAGFEAVCSAYGGYNYPGDDPFHLQRIPADNVMMRVKNWTTIDPRKAGVIRFEYGRSHATHEPVRSGCDENRPAR